MVTLEARSPRRSPGGPAAAAHIFALATLAVAEPLFSLLSRQAELFVAHGAQPLDLVLITLLLSVALPAVLLLPVLLTARLSRPAARWTHVALVAGLSGLITLLLVKRLAPEAPATPALAAASVLALTIAACYRRWSAVQTFLTLVSPVALLSPVLFLFASPVRLMLLPGGWAGEEGGGAAYVPVVMVVLDELPLSSLLDESNQIDPFRYPNLAALAGDAYWFRDATTVATSTAYSVPIILSGRIPDRSLLPVAGHYPDNLFTWLAGAGYRLRVLETQTRICPRELCAQSLIRRDFVERFDALTTDLAVIYLHLLLPADFAGRLPAIDATWHGFAQRTIGTRLKQLLGAAPETSARKRRRDAPGLFATFLESIVGDDRPELHFIHLMLPHVPFKYLPSGKEYGPVGAPVHPHGVVKDTWGADEWEVAQGYQRHLLQVGYVDSLIGKLLAKLKQQDLYNPALIILVADHGASFRPLASRRGASAGNFADILNIPLLVKLPGQQRGVLSERNVETIDILPTIADALDLDLPWPADGRSAIGSGQPGRGRKSTLGAFREDAFERRLWDIEALRAGRRQSVTRKLRMFGSGTKPGGLLRIGRRADLVGRRLSEIGVFGPAAAEPATDVELEQAWFYDQVDPNSPFIPAHVTGRARFARPRNVPVELAVAVNGTVEAVTRTFGHAGDRARFTAMVREDAFRAGRNLVEIFEISGRRAGVLVPTRKPGGGRFTLQGVPGDESLRTADGHLIPLVKGHLRGKAKLRKNPMGTRLSGWAAVGAGKQAAETLLVFIDGRLVLVTVPGLAPDDRRAKAMKLRRREASFRIWLPDSLTAGSQEIRLIAILGNAASEIAVMPLAS